MGNQVLETSCLLGNQLFSLTARLASCAGLQGKSLVYLVNLNAMCLTEIRNSEM